MAPNQVKTSPSQRNDKVAHDPDYPKQNRIQEDWPTERRSVWTRATCEAIERRENGQIEIRVAKVKRREEKRKTKMTFECVRKWVKPREWRTADDT